MDQENGIFIGRGSQPVHLLPRYANRHGLIAGATGTGKTVTLQVLAEGFSDIGVPVFLSDVKGDLSGLAQPSESKPFLLERAREVGMEPWEQRGYATVFWDLFGEKGHPIRTTPTEMGPMLLSRLLELNPTQEGVLTVAFHHAEQEGYAVMDLKDIRTVLQLALEERDKLQATVGNVTAQSIGAIQRKLLVLEKQGAEQFFGEPALDIQDFMRTVPDGRGAINVLASDRLIQKPRLYATFLLWLLSELFEELPEVGDPEKPKLVFFFDEAHLLFNDAPRPLLEKVEQVVRLVRSKGVGIYFVTQNPLDVPETVLGQLGNRIQHALRAFTPRDQKAVRTAASTFRQNPALDTEAVITQMGVGEALVSTLQEKGVPAPVEQTLIRPPTSRIGPADEALVDRIRAQSPLGEKYEAALDTRSAYELYQERLSQRARMEQEQEELDRRREEIEAQRKAQQRSSSRQTSSRRSSRSDTPLEAAAKTALREITRHVIRGFMGNLTRRR